jgi:HEPN domain-containing protein
MPQTDDNKSGRDKSGPYNIDQQGMPSDNDAELERLLIEGVHLIQEKVPPPLRSFKNEDDDENTDVPSGGDIQGALGLYAEAAQDMATAGVELGLGRHFACADFCNQAAEKAAQSVSLLRSGRRSMYDHDLRALGALVGAPEEIQDEMAILTPFHPEAFYAGTPPEEADEVINAEQASSYIQSARHVLRWARAIVLNA